MFARIVPSYVPWPRAVVLATGVCEIIAALALLQPRLRPPVGWALIAFAICVTPVHIDMLRNQSRYEIAPALLWLRLALQPVLIWIVWRVAVRSA